MEPKQLQRIEDKLDAIGEKIGQIEVTLGKQQVILEEHERRSRANEEAVKILAAEVKPIAVHVMLVQYIGKGVIAILGSASIWKLIAFLSKFT